MAEDDFEYNNEEEAEMAQLHSIHMHMNAVAEVQRALQEQRSHASLEYCEDCGDEIPPKRRELIRGVTRCIYCQEVWERDRAMHARPGTHNQE